MPVGHGAYVPRRRLILISEQLARGSAGERVTLAHEIVHLDLGHLSHLDDVLEARQELQTSRETARRLIGFEELKRVVATAMSVEEAADELHVDTATFIERIELLSPDEQAVIDELAGDGCAGCP